MANGTRGWRVRPQGLLAAAALLSTNAVAYGGPKPLAEKAPLFSEGFEDDPLLQRGFYDGDRFKITAVEATFRQRLYRVPLAERRHQP